MTERVASPPEVPSAVSLPSDRAFVVQFAGGTGEGSLRGRVEHLASGQAARFDSWARLREFLERRLGEGGAPGSDPGGRDGRTNAKD